MFFIETGASPSSSARRACATSPSTGRRADSPRRRRILFLDHTANLGGGEIALLNLVKHLDRTQFHPIVALWSTGPLVEKLKDSGIETIVMPLSPQVINTRKDSLGPGIFLQMRALIQSLTFILRLARFIQQREIDLVHTNSLKADIIGGIAARLACRPVIWHVRDRIADDYLPPIVARVFRSLCRIIPNYVLANSHATLQTVVSGRRAVAVPSGIDLRRRDGVAHDGTQLQELNLPTGSSPDRTPVIGLVGRISPWKGQHIFIRAARIVLARYPHARFQIIGAPLFAEQDYERQLRELVGELGIADRVEFTGFQENVNEWIRRLDILVHASTVGEPFGQVVIEGMSAGKPVIATNGGGVPEIVLDGVTGILVPMGDVAAMSAAMHRLLADPSGASAMGLAGRKRVADRFTIQRTADVVQSVYRQLLFSARSRKQKQ